MKQLTKLQIINQINRVLGYHFVNEGFIDLYSKSELFEIYKAVVIDKKIPVYSEIDDSDVIFIYRTNL